MAKKEKQQNSDPADGRIAPGAVMKDGSVFAGLSADGKFQIFAMPGDLSITMTFNDAAKEVRSLNEKKALGHDDWKIPTFSTLKVIKKNRNKGSLKNSFKTTQEKWEGHELKFLYWSSTESYSYGVRVLHFSDDRHSEGARWPHQDARRSRLSCRPVRLVKVSAPRPDVG